jgi:hypothetical protein
MNAKELRIGNFLEGKNGIVKVTRIFDEDHVGIGAGDPYFVSGENPCLKPIELTEEILLKFGFDKKSNNVYFILVGKCLLEYNNVHHFLDIVKRVNFDIDIEIKYVHELQNVFFAITGSEIEFKNIEE